MDGAVGATGGCTLRAHGTPLYGLLPQSWVNSEVVGYRFLDRRVDLCVIEEPTRFFLTAEVVDVAAQSRSEVLFRGVECGHHRRSDGWEHIPVAVGMPTAEHISDHTGR